MPAPRKDDITNGRVRERGEAVEEESCFLYTNQPVCGGGKSAGAVFPLLAVKNKHFSNQGFIFLFLLKEHCRKFQYFPLLA